MSEPEILTEIPLLKLLKCNCILFPIPLMQPLQEAGRESLSEFHADIS
jgi:hypothetical protein